MRGVTSEATETHRSFGTGAVRSKESDGVRYDLISPFALRRLAETHHEGAIKYGPNNFRQGFPYGVMVNHCLDHVFKYLRGDRSEDHLAHATWNLCALMEFEETHPQLDDLPFSPTRRPEAEYV